jgi:hypothetical protein
MESRPVVFVCGPYRADSAWEIEQNVRRAEEVALYLWREGAVAVCPHAMTRYYQGAADDDLWLSGMRILLMRCDAVVTVGEWRQSEGSRLEVDVAAECGMPIFASVESLLAALPFP